MLFYAFAVTGAFHGTGQHFADIVPLTEFPIALKVCGRICSFQNGLSNSNSVVVGL